MIELSSSLKLNKIHLVDSSFNGDPKIFSRKGQAENLGKWGITGTSIVMRIGVVNLERKYQPLHPGTKILVMPQFSYMPDQILEKE